jgi:hypothetical protein
MTGTRGLSPLLPKKRKNLKTFIFLTKILDKRKAT